MTDTMSPAGWSEAPTDVLWKIVELLPAADYIRFAAVCVSWCSALAEKRRRPATQPPWLLLPGDDTITPTTTDTTLRFFSLSEKRDYQIPRLPGGRRRYVGSSDGWLVWIDDSAELHMLDPISGSCVDLPSITTFPDVNGVSRDSDGRINGYFIQPPGPRPPQFLNIEFMRARYFTKIIVAPGSTPTSYSTVVIHSMPERISVARAGDESWGAVQMMEIGFLDVIFHDGLLYAVDYLGKVVTCDLCDLASPSIAPVGPEFATVDCPRYLVMSAGELLQVERKVRYFPSDDEWEGGRSGVRITTLFTVYKLDSANEWVRVESLDNHSLFLGLNCSVSLSAIEFPELRRDCIYYTDDNKEDCLPMPHQRRDLGVYHLVNGRVDPHYPADSNLNWPPPIWFAPRLA